MLQDVTSQDNDNEYKIYFINQLFSTWTLTNFIHRKRNIFINKGLIIIRMNFHDHRVRHIFIIINLGTLSIAWTLNISASHLQQAAPGHEAGGGAAHQPLPGAHTEDLPLQHVAGDLDAEGGVLQDGRHEHSVDTGLLKQASI